MLIGALLTPCNIYSGLKIGWSFNISIIALLIASGFWTLLARLQISGRLAAGRPSMDQYWSVPVTGSNAWTAQPSMSTQ